MHLSKTPLRVTLGGGGSDLGTGGLCINMAVNLYTYVAVNHHHGDDDYSLKYSEIERVYDLDDIRHDLLRRTLKRLDVKPGVEITSMSDVPGNSGLGSSGAFTVGLLRALRPDMSNFEIVTNAIALDTGMQDQYAATYGGLNLWRFGGHDRHRDVPQQRTPLEVPSWFFGLALYDTGLKRDAYETLRRTRRPDENILRQQVADMRAALHDPTKFSDCLNAQWKAKLDAAPTETHRYIDHLIKGLRRDGAWGAKLIGAGEGGMILTFSQEIVPSQLRRIAIKVDEEGTRLL